MVNLITSAECVNASSSSSGNPFANLNNGKTGCWVSDIEKHFPAFLNFDLQKNYLLEKISITADEREAAPKNMRLDYFGNDLKLIGRDIAKFSFEAADENFLKCQEFQLDCQIHAVKFIRIRILDGWGAGFVKIQSIDFFGKQSKASISWKKEEPVSSEFAQWYIGDRVRYLGPDGKKWYEGKIIHINPSETYLIQDDHGWVKDHIKPKNTRRPRYPRKPRKLKASTSQISVSTILEDSKKEQDFSDSSSSTSGSEGSYDEAPYVMKEEYELYKRSSLNTNEEKEVINELLKGDSKVRKPKPIPLLKAKKKAVIAQSFSKEVLNGVYLISSERKGGRPMYKDGGGRVIWWYRDVKTWMICMEHLVGTDRAYACALDSAMHPADIKTKWNVYNKITGAFRLDPAAKISPFDCSSFNNDDKKEEISATIIAKNFTKAINGTYILTSARQYGRPMFQRTDMKITLWWYLKSQMWMFSPSKYVGTEKCFSYCQDTALYPYDVKSGWTSYTSATKRYLPDPGLIVPGEKVKRPKPTPVSSATQKHHKTDTPLRRPALQKHLSAPNLNPIEQDGDKNEQNIIKRHIMRNGRFKGNETTLIIRQRSSSNPKIMRQIKGKLTTECSRRPRSQSNPPTSTLSSRRVDLSKHSSAQRCGLVGA